MVITGYVLERTTVGNAIVDLINVGNVLTYSDVDLENGDYSYRVAAVNAIGTSAYSAKADVTVDAAVLTVPAAPANIVTYAHDGMVELVWQAPLADGGSSITNYKVYRGDSSGNLVLWSTLGNVLTYLDFNVVNGQTYYYAVSAVNSVEKGRSRSRSSRPPPVCPPPIEPHRRPGRGRRNPELGEALDDGGADLTYNLLRGEVSATSFC
jgi:fibronectin type 3 domain-containing protein